MSYAEDKDVIANMFDRMLDQINSVFEQAGVSLPSRQYAYAGELGATSYDCEQLTLSLGQIYSGTPGAQSPVPTKCNEPITGVFYVELVRCIPDKLSVVGPKVRKPAPTLLTLNAKAQSIDAYLLMQAGQLFGDDYLGSVVTVTSGQPSGVYQAIILEVATGIY